MLQISDTARQRIQDGLKKYTRIVTQARQRGMNERDTGDIVKAMLGDMLGYDPFFDVTAEVSVCGKGADHAVILDGSLKFLLLVKAVGCECHAAHLLRLSGANAPPYCEWAILTNGAEWACYRLGVGADRHAEPVLRVSLLDTKSVDDRAALFALLSKESVAQDGLTQHWEQTRALNPGRLAALLLSDEVLNVLKRELWRSASYRAEKHVLVKALMRDILRADALAARTLTPNELTLPHCFAYVVSPSDRATWHLPYRHEDGTPHPDALMHSASLLSGDVRTLGIPPDDLPLVKQRLRQACRELSIADDDLPASLRR